MIARQAPETSTSELIATISGRVPTRNLHSLVLWQLGVAIVGGDYPEGSILPSDTDLLARFKVSRTVLREALKTLAAKGMIEARARIGTRVLPRRRWNLFDADVLSWLLERKFSLDLLVQFNQLRSAIEPAAAALAAQHADEAGLATIRAGFARMVAAEAGDDDPLEADIAFHLAILRASTNPFFAQFSDVVATALRTSIRFTNRIQGRTADLAAHEAVKTAIERHDAEQAHAAMRTIVQDVMRLIAQTPGA